MVEKITNEVKTLIAHQRNLKSPMAPQRLAFATLLTNHRRHIKTDYQRYPVAQ